MKIILAAHLAAVGYAVPVLAQSAQHVPRGVVEAMRIVSSNVIARYRVAAR